MNSRTWLLKTLMGFMLFLPVFSYAKPGNGKNAEKLPAWKKGEMEIHQISTNCGESSFLIFPDGTSLLIDAGDMRTPRYFPPISEDINPGEKIARYILSVNPSEQKVDYFLATHFDPDHIGDAVSGKNRSKSQQGDFLLLGIAEVAQSLQFGKIIDRGWPDYARPQQYDTLNPSFANYRKFLDWELNSNKTVIEGFEVGKTNQFNLLHNSKYAGKFLVRNIACNGVVWQWRKNELDDYVHVNPKNLEKKVSENLMSCALLFTYGNFSYFAGGDFCGNLLDKDGNEINIETRLGEAAGEVDVCKSNHHGYHDAMIPGFIEQVNAHIYTMPVHDSAHLGEKVVPCLEKRVEVMRDTEALIIPTHFPDEMRKNYTGYQFMKHIPPVSGHIVIKVAPGGKSYRVYILNDSDEQHKIKLKLGPFISKTKMYQFFRQD